jgi:hypothetical protein
VHSCWSQGGFGGEEGIQAAQGKKLEWPDSELRIPHDLTPVIWNANTGRLASRHGFTMFWASDVFAPKCLIDGLPASEWLQEKFINAYGQ